MANEDYELVIGDKRWSSWSLRPWLLMKAFKIPFRERLIRLRWEGTTEEIARHSPSGRVPLLKLAAAGGEPLTVWDSLAIIEFLAEMPVIEVTSAVSSNPSSTAVMRVSVSASRR